MLWDLFNFNSEKKIADAVTAGRIPSIGSDKELEVYLRCKLKDEEFAKLFAKIMSKLGHDGVVEIKKGGSGNPYQVEYLSSNTFEIMPKIEKKKREQEIIELLESDSSISATRQQEYRNELAQLSDSHIIIWVNSKSDEDFKLKEDIFVEAIDTMKKAFNS